jgi:hypothetical protein
MVAANLRFAVKIQDIGKPEARRHQIHSKAVTRQSSWNQTKVPVRKSKCAQSPGMAVVGLLAYLLCVTLIVT